jgi:hypothetical protein
MAEHVTGRPISWASVGAIVVGFIVGGLGLVLGPNWPLFWVGIAIILVSGIVALATGIMDDYGTR